jgi:hypothetical protein
VLRQRVEQIDRLLDAARLTGAGITSSALALARGAADKGDGDANAPMLVLGRQGAEMVWRNAAGAPRMLRHVAVVAVNGRGPVSISPIGSEVGRAITLTRGNGTPASRDMVLWDGVGLSSEQVDELSSRSGLRVRPSDALATLGVETAPDALAGGGGGGEDDHGPSATDADVFAPALSLALAAGDRDRLPIDFKRSRLAPPKQRRVGRGTTWGVIIAAVLVLGLGGLYLAAERRQGELDSLEQSLKDNVDNVKAAQASVERYTVAKGFFDTRPPMLDALAEISKLFRDNESIWVTSFTAKDDRKINLQGKADSERTVRALLTRIKENPTKFADAQLLNIAAQEGTQKRSPEVSFSIRFSYIVTE